MPFYQFEQVWPFFSGINKVFSHRTAAHGICSLFRTILCKPIEMVEGENPNRSAVSEMPKATSGSKSLKLPFFPILMILSLNFRRLP